MAAFNNMIHRLTIVLLKKQIQYNTQQCIHTLKIEKSKKK